MFNYEVIRMHWKKIVTLIIVFISTVTVLILILTRGYLGVTVVGYIPDATGIVVTDSNGNDIRLSGNESSHFLLPHGSYAVKVGAGDMHTQQAIDVGFFSFNTITITLHETHPIIALTNINTADVNPYADGKKFIDTTVRRLTFIADSGELRYVGPLSVGFVRWFDANRGLIASRDVISGEFELSEINGEDTRKITIPNLENATSMSAAVVDNSIAYIIIDDRLYRYDDGEVSFVDTLDIPSASLSSASMDNVLISGQRLEDDSPVQVLSLYNIAEKKSKDIPVISMSARYGGVSSSWSGDGNLFSVTSGSTVAVYDKLGESVDLSIPATTITAASWDNNKLILASESVLWSYDKDNGTLVASSKLLPYIIIDTVVAHDNTYYIRADHQSGTTLYRYTDSKDTDEVADILSGSDMRFLQPACYINFLNYSQKTIVLFDAGANETACITSIQTYLDVFQIQSKINIQINKEDSFGRSS